MASVKPFGLGALRGKARALSSVEVASRAEQMAHRYEARIAEQKRIIERLQLENARLRRECTCSDGS